MAGSGDLYGIGANNNGQLGISSTSSSHTPVQGASPLSTLSIRSIAAGMNHDRTTAEVVSALSSHTVVKASCGSYHSVFLTSGSL
eukprot:gene23352-28260_t